MKGDIESNTIDRTHRDVLHSTAPFAHKPVVDKLMLCSIYPRPASDRHKAAVPLTRCCLGRCSSATQRLILACSGTAGAAGFLPLHCPRYGSRPARGANRPSGSGAW